MAGITATRSRTTAGVDDQRRSALEEMARRYARLAAGLLDAPIGAVQLEPGGAAFVYEADAYNEGPSYEEARALCATLGNQLWFGRSAVAIPDPNGVPSTNDYRMPDGLGACLAAPLAGRSGSFLGTICVAQAGVRKWTAEEMDRLRALAASASEEMDREEAVTGPRAVSGASGSLDEFVTAAMGMLRDGATRAQRSASTEETVEALQAALEELQTSVEELQLMNEELHATRFMVKLEKEHYRELFECVPHPYLITNQEGIIREVNDAAATLLGARRSFLIGKPLAVFIPEDGRTPFRKRLRELRGGGRMEWQLDVTPRGQAPKHMMCAASAMRSRDSDAERVYWLLRELPESEVGSGAVEGAATEAHETTAAKSQDFEELIAQATLRPGVAVVEQLRDLIAGAHDMGSLQVGQRLPSIRAIADRFGVTSYAALQAYASLEAEGVVERRERSGVYVAPVDWPVPPRLPETAEWLASVLTQACEHQVRIPHFPDLVRRWTGSVAIKAACVESCEDSLVALTHELSNRFGVTAVPVAINDIVGTDGSPRRASALPAAIHEAQLLVTTPFHASQLRAIAESTGKPLLVATLNREIVDAVEAHLADHELTVVCVDRGAGERLRNLQGGAFRDRIRVVLADQLESAGLDRSQPVFLTLAARQRLNGASLRLIAPPTPSFSLEFARKVSGTLLRLNIDGGRG